jgi:chloramphenicol O-acetyltransferase type A
MDLLYFTTLPWISFTSFKHAHDPRINASIPRITIGKFTKNASKVLLPVHVEVNHALCDGLHVGRFFHALEKRTQ